MSAPSNLLNKLCHDLPVGKLDWIGLRSEHKGEVLDVNEARALEGLGLQGDHRCDKTPGSARQVTLISREFIAQIEAHLGRGAIAPALLRRNLVISGINLHLLRYQKIQIGDAVLEASALCHPCSRMNAALGEGGAAAMYGAGGLCAKILRGGTLRVGDPVRCLVSVDG